MHIFLLEHMHLSSMTTILIEEIERQNFQYIAQGSQLETGRGRV